MRKKWPWYRLDEGYGWDQNLLMWVYALAAIGCVAALVGWLL